jgi:hypothetical protein
MEMNMRKVVLITAAIVALVGAGIAAAWDGSDSKAVKSVDATFTATSASVVKTSTCTGADGTYALTKASYTGTATSSEPTLNGPISLDTQSVVNTTTGFGTLSANVQIGTHPNATSAQFDAVVSGGNAVGLANGQAQGPHNQLLANVSAAYSATGGFTNGFIGHGASGGDGVEVAPGGCKPVPAPKPDRIEVHGSVSTISATSITAAGVTCGIPTSLAASVAALNLVATTSTTSGTQVDMTCTASGGVTTLAKISAPPSPKHGKLRHDRRR